MEIKEFNLYRFDYETGVMTDKAFIAVCLEFIEENTKDIQCINESIDDILDVFLKVKNSNQCDGCIHNINNNEDNCASDEVCIRWKHIPDLYNQAKGN